MTKEEIRTLKVNTVKMGLFHECRNKLWEARNHLDDATKENGMIFSKALAKAKSAIADAEQLWDEQERAYEIV